MSWSTGCPSWPGGRAKKGRAAGNISQNFKKPAWNDVRARDRHQETGPISRHDHGIWYVGNEYPSCLDVESPATRTPVPAGGHQRSISRASPSTRSAAEQAEMRLTMSL